MKSIRSFLIVVLLISITLINFIAASYGYRSSMADAEQLFDKRLAELAGVLAETPPGLYRMVTGDSAIAFQIWQGGQLAASSANAPAELITRLEPGFADVRFGGFYWRTFVLAAPESERWVVVAESSDIRFTLADDIILGSVLPLILGLPLFALLIWIIVGRGLRPLDDLAKEMRFKRSDDLSGISNLQPPKELAVLVSSINDLLQRLNASFERERQFAADAAHELRTPISVVQVQLHNLLKDSTADNPPLQALQESVDRMEHSVEQVLMLYRMAPDQFIANFQNIDLANLARKTIAEHYPQLRAKRQQIELVAEPAIMVGDAFAIQRLLSNLIVNASRYSREGDAIKVTVEPRATETVLTVADNGPGIPARYRQRIFERFYRGEHNADAAGSGIGLAIVKNIASIHAADVSLGESEFESGLAVRVVFRNSQPQAE